jgi:MATE family, multidrug efflux pump
MSQPQSAMEKTLWRLSIPIMISFTARFLFGLVDLGYAVAIQDPDAVAAIGFYLPIQTLYGAVWVGLSGGFTANLSQAMGYGDSARIEKLKRAAIKLLLILIPLLSIFGGLFQFAIPYFGLEPGLTTAFAIYAGVLMVGSPLTGFWSIIPDSIIKAHHDTHSTMVAGLVSTVANVSLNTLFVFGFGMGILGIALATVLSRFASLTYALIRARSLERARLRPSTDDTPRAPEPRPTYRRGPVPGIVILALPGMVAYLLSAVEGGVVNGVLTGLPKSTIAIASFGVYARLLGLALMPAIGASIAVLPFVSRRRAEGRSAELGRELRETFLLCLSLAIVITLPIATFLNETLATLILPEELKGSQETIQATMEILRLLPLAALGALPFALLRPVFEAVHQARTGLLISMLRFFVFALPLIFVGVQFAPDLGISSLTGLVLGLLLASILASVATLYYVRRALQS